MPPEDGLDKGEERKEFPLLPHERTDNYSSLSSLRSLSARTLPERAEPPLRERERFELEA